MAWTTACPDWAERIVARRSLVPSPPIFPEMAAKALDFFKSLQMTDLPMRRDGRHPTMGEACEPFVFDLVASLFGAQDPLTGASLVKEAMLLVSKKNGKSTIAAGIMLTALALNWRHGAELLVIAPTIEGANNGFGPAAKMVRADSELATVFAVQDHKRTIRDLRFGSELKIVAADASVVAGKKAGFVLVDELWQFGKRADAEAMLEEATGGQAARPEGWTLYLSTHSDDIPAGVFKNKLDYFRSVRDGEVVDPTTLPMLYEWPDEMLEARAYLDPANFYITNPNIGKSQTVEFITRKLTQARSGDASDGDSTIQIVLAKYLNVEIGQRLRSDRWRGADSWEKQGDPSIAGLDDFLDRCEVVVAGFDGGGNDDLTGLALIGRCRKTHDWLHWGHAWAHVVALETRKEIAPMLRDFAASGDLTIWGQGGAGRDDDLVGVADILAIVRDRGLLPAKDAVGMDPVGLRTLDDMLKRRGFEMDQLTAVGQGYRLTGVIQTVERKLWDGTLTHGGRPMMAWSVSNARVEQKGNAVVITKQMSGKAKIDPVMALFDAATMMQYAPDAAAIVTSPWDDPEFRLAAA